MAAVPVDLPGGCGYVRCPATHRSAFYRDRKYTHWGKRKLKRDE